MAVNLAGFFSGRFSGEPPLKCCTALHGNYLRQSDATLRRAGAELHYSYINILFLHGVVIRRRRGQGV
jgi:hypothetical protein